MDRRAVCRAYPRGHGPRRDPRPRHVRRRRPNSSAACRSRPARIDQTWDGFNFANGTATETGRRDVRRLCRLAAPHHITLRSHPVPALGGRTGAHADLTDHGRRHLLGHAIGGPHDLLLEDITVDGRGRRLATAFQFYHAAPANPTPGIRRSGVSRSSGRTGDLALGPTLQNITVDRVRDPEAMAHAVRYEGGIGIHLSQHHLDRIGRSGFYSSLGTTTRGASPSATTRSSEPASLDGRVPRTASSDRRRWRRTLARGAPRRYAPRVTDPHGPSKPSLAPRPRSTAASAARRCTTHSSTSGPQPLCESFVAPEDVERMEPFYPLHVRICRECLLVQLPALRRPRGHLPRVRVLLVLLATAGWSTPRRYVDAMIAAPRASAPTSLVVELASNDGYLLQHFVARGHPRPRHRAGAQRRRGRRGARRPDADGVLRRATSPSSCVARARARRPGHRQQRPGPRAGPQRLRRRDRDPARSPTASRRSSSRTSSGSSRASSSTRSTTSTSRTSR